MNPEYLPCVETGAPDATHAVIWLHGLGADGHDFEPLVPELGLDGRGLRFVFPHAPVRRVTVNAGMAMRAWYDIVDLDLRREPDLDGLVTSSGQLADLIAREGERGIPPRRILLAGFSQGGAVVLHRALRLPEPVAGIVALSTYLPGAPASTPPPYDPGSLPVFQAHGALDPVVPLERGEATRDRLRDLGFPVTFQSYAMPHAVCAEEIRDLAGWMAARLDETAG